MEKELGVKVRRELMEKGLGREVASDGSIG